MARKPLRSQLNQIRTWVRQGRTDAWIAHQLEISASELREFRRRHGLSAEAEDPSELDLRDEIEAEIEAAAAEEEAERAEAEAAEAARAAEQAEKAASEPESEQDEDDEDADQGRDEPPARRRRDEGRDDGDGDGEEARPRRRRRGRRGRGGRPGAALQATFDHGEYDGFGMWFDPALQEDPIYSEHWSGHRKVEVTVEPERIVIKRV